MELRRALPLNSEAMNSQDFSIITLILHASFVVQLVMLLLVVVSVASWAAIIRKYFALRRMRALNDEFERDFWSGTSLNELFASAAQNAKFAGPMERIFASGMREYQKLRERHISDADTLLEGARRAMRASFQRELDAAESNLSFLATVGSVSPYVGLFGTVWGIMHAFTGLAAMTQVTLATVAPGIAEALVATAIGLFAAIPAVVGYNRFARKSEGTVVASVGSDPLIVTGSFGKGTLFHTRLVNVLLTDDGSVYAGAVTESALTSAASQAPKASPTAGPVHLKTPGGPLDLVPAPAAGSERPYMRMLPPLLARVAPLKLM